jgi:hypothetical protein
LHKMTPDFQDRPIAWRITSFIKMISARIISCGAK